MNRQAAPAAGPDGPGPSMRAVVWRRGAPVVEARYPRPSPAADEALLQVRLAGICSTDLEMVRGYVPGFQGVLGHEFVADVVAAADDSWLGRRVVGAINVGCGVCDTCRRHGPEHCPQRQALGIHGRDGAFADYLTLPLRNLVAVPEAVVDAAAVFVEPLAAAWRIREQIAINEGMVAAVVGPGRLGLLVGQVLSLAGAAVTMLGHRPASLALPHQMGLATGLAADQPAASFDLVVAATGNAAGLAQALRLVRPLGTVVVKSTFAGETTMDMTRVVVSEITLVGSRCGPFPPALQLLAAGAVDVAPLVDAVYPLEQATAAFAHASRPGVRKILLQP